MAVGRVHAATLHFNRADQERSVLSYSSSGFDVAGNNRLIFYVDQKKLSNDASV